MSLRTVALSKYVLLVPVESRPHKIANALFMCVFLCAYMTKVYCANRCLKWTEIFF